MKLTLESRGKHLIRGYAAGEVRVDDQTIHYNCLIAPDQIAAWGAAEHITMDDVQPILALAPEVVIMGLENMQQLPVAAIYAAFLERGIGFEVMNIGAACRTFNILMAEDRRVVAALLFKSSS